MAGSDKSSDIVSDYTKLLRRSLAVPEIAASVLTTTVPARNARPCALLLSPHPDDECLTGALPLRLEQEQDWQIINLAVTLGGNIRRRAGRAEELSKACAALGFNGVLGQEDGFSNVTLACREGQVRDWQQMVVKVGGIISQLKPQAVFMPHALDAHPAHSGTFWLGMDALAQQPKEFVCAVFQTEYWQPHEAPNLLVGLSEADAATLLSALTCHEGENARNPFDVRFPAYLIDNVRRGSERIGGAGMASVAMDFAMLYKFGVWSQGRFIPSALRRMIGPKDSLSELMTA